MEYVYRLNLPSFYEAKLPDFSLDKFFGNSLIRGHKPVEFLKPEYCQLKNLDWRFSLSFKKFPGSVSIKHVDNPSLEDPLLRWGINWIVGKGGMKYWHREQIESYESEIDDAGYTRARLNITQPCFRDYKTIDGGVYLVNARAPHQAYNDDPNLIRYALSTRIDFKNNPKTWEEVVELFKDLIIEY
jgi:hypothetical protein